MAIMRRQIAAIAENWNAVCKEAALSDAGRRLLWRRQFLNDWAFAGLEDRLGDVLESIARASARNSGGTILQERTPSDENIFPSLDSG